MALDLGAAALVRAGSGVLYVGLGAALLASRRRRDVAVASLGVLALSFGATYVLVNIFAPDQALRPLAVAARGACWLIAGAAALVYAWRVSTRALAPWVLLGSAAGGALFLAGALAEPDFESSPWAIRGAATSLGIGIVVILPTALAAASLGASHERTRANALVATAFAVYIAYIAGNGVLGDTSSLARSGSIVAVVATALGVALWLIVTARGGGRPARNAALVAAAGMLAGMIAVALVGIPAARSDGLPPRDWGGVGVARILGWMVLVYAIVKADILGLGLAKRSIDRSTLAASGLALLFIVAQVAQNFLSATYGLLTGGIVAGAFLFAANPVQRAIEQMRAPVAESAASLPADHGSRLHERESAYREAVRLALKDRRLTREEDRHLLRLAHHLGIPSPRAMEIHDEVEREMGLA